MRLGDSSVAHPRILALQALARLLTLPESVTLLLVVVLVLAFVAYKVTTEDERARFASHLRARLQDGVATVAERCEAQKPFFDGLRARTRWAPVTPAIVLINITVFAIVIVASVPADRDVLIEWGASIGPRTTNGEWWRLVTSLFVHAGPLHLLACVIGFFPLGRVMERLVGSVALLAVYITAGVFAGLTTLSVSPMAVSTGASGAVCGVYGLSVATAAWGLVRRPGLAVPWEVVKWLAWAGLVFLAYNVPTGVIPLQAELTGFVVGVLCGAAIGEDVAAGRTPVTRSAGMMALAFVLAIVVAVPLSGLSDVRPEIGRMMATDERTAATFRAAATQLALGRKTEKALIDLIEHEIVPALEREQSHLALKDHVPDDQKALRATASEYVRLRLEGWRLRATAFRKGSLAMLRQADNKEGAARDLLARHPLAPT